jgi:hypothetical protein
VPLHGKLGDLQSGKTARIQANAVKYGLWEKMTPAEARQFQTLTHPEHLGRPYRVLVQSRKGL